MPALSRKGDELFLRWLSDPETEPALQDWLWQIQSEITHLLVMLGSKVQRQEDFVVFQQGLGQSASPLEVVDVLGPSWTLLWTKCGIIQQKAHHQDCRDFGRSSLLTGRKPVLDLRAPLSLQGEIF
ncbi:hypothetical protein STEG23_002785 [Scotinomys teguina]